MQYDRMLAELFSEEDRAREMAARLADIARTSKEAARARSGRACSRSSAARSSGTSRSRSRSCSPSWRSTTSGPEVQVADQAARRGAPARAQAGRRGPPGDDIGDLVFEIARLLLHHTNFEGDYIYPELTHDEWRELMKETVAQGETSANAPPPLGAATIEGAVRSVNS